MTVPEPPRFAALGHQEDWEQIAAIVGGLRPPGMPPVSTADLRSLLPYIPPRTVSRFSVAARPEETLRLGAVYIDTFLSPDELGGRPTRKMLARVQDAIAAAEREGVSVVALGGFTSVLLESDNFKIDTRVHLTTGNTLTTALIVRGVERATKLLGRDLANEDVVIIGATGDVGSACARVLNGKVRTLLLTARNHDRLERESTALASSGPVEWSTDVQSMLGRATLVIAAAATSGSAFDIAGCQVDAIVCDAGYPKNIGVADRESGRRLFWGGMGVLAGGLRSYDGNLERFYKFPVQDVAHGCMLEGAVLALAGRFECFSRGRGRITPGQVDEIWRLALQQGVQLAPLFNSAGVWPEEQTPA